VQFVQAVWPVSVTKYPTGHGVAVDRPVPAQYLPAGQVTLAVQPKVEQNEPVGVVKHKVGEFAPEVARKVPSGHEAAADMPVALQ
jgi:hypothetical protein